MRHLLVSAILATGLPSVVPAQITAPLPRFGITAGVNIAKISGDNINGAKNKTGFSFGATAVVPMGSAFSFAPELVYTMKGAKFSDQNVDGSFKLNYIELPILLRYDIPVVGTTKPFLLAGPALAFQTSCKVSAEDQGVTVSVGCNQFTNEDMKKFDTGAMFGGGASFALGGRMMSLGVRYNLGLMDLAKNQDAKSRVLSFVGTFEWLRLR
jgi:Outer membrane protein beta-barrel domain